ncbi:hypothetical protein EcCFBP13530_13885 [Enterobacter cancerogenus]|uniref:Uncharacterized protein n=1 Tax=Enterobacter cancerogenus TaxID=69218 RepID=A0AB38P214_9ENTR|nr:hypothetical protein CWI88_18210 [Enterobacter cancerogenus]TKK17452.1 hypothetical protein EcCFBP13530_13885 [Enterobacter cancerogenus]
MLFLRNIQAQRPDSLVFHISVIEEISQIYVFSPSPVGEGRGEGISPHLPYEYFFVRRVGAVFAGSSGQTCFG